MVNMKMLIAGAGAASVAGAAIVTQIVRDDDQPGAGRETAGYEVCLKSNLAFFEGVSAKCYAQADLAALRSKPVIDGEGAPVGLVMTHPGDASITPAEVRTCADYGERAFDGWYAATSREMRREGFFIRACGTLAALAEAQPAERSYFTEGSPDAEGVAALSGALRFGEAGVLPETARAEKSAAHEWRLTAGAMTLTLQELANADFDNDGIEEILAFAAGAPAGGSAVFYEAGLIEKDSEAAAVLFTPLTFGRQAASGVGG